MNVQAASGNIALEDLRGVTNLPERPRPGSGGTDVVSAEDVAEPNQSGQPDTFNASSEGLEQRVVWSAYLPAGVSPNSWVQSLDEALRALDVSEQTVIEVRGRVVIEEPVNIASRSVTLTGAADSAASIEFAPTLVRNLQAGAAPISLQGGQLAMSNLEIRFDGSKVDPSLENEDGVGVFRVTGNSSVALSKSVITLMDPVRANRFALNEGEARLAESRVSAFLIDEASGGFSVATVGLATMPIEDYRDVDITFDESFVRGYGRVIDLDANLAIANRSKFEFRRSVFAVSDVILNAGNVIAGSGGQVDRNLRVTCENATFFAASGFARLVFQDVRDPLLSIRRTSHNCVFESAFGGGAHVAIRGLERESAVAVLGRSDFDGGDNVYSDTISDILTVLSREGRKLLSFKFNSGSRLEWFRERDNERVLRWLDTDRNFLGTLSEVEQQRFLLPVGPDVPGFQSESQTLGNTRLLPPDSRSG